MESKLLLSGIRIIYKKTVMVRKVSFISKLARKNRFFTTLTWSAYNAYACVLRLLPNTLFANYLSLTHHRGFLNLSNPRTYNEKLWWLKYHYRNPLQKVCSDKYMVREYLCDLGVDCAELRLPMINSFSTVDQITTKGIEDEVIFKLNVGSGANLIYNPKNPIPEKALKDFFSKRMKHNYYLDSREWNFLGIKPVIVVEPVLRDKNGNLPVDYKFMCFHGKPEVVFVSEGAMDATGRHSVHGERFTNVYDMEWQLTEIESSYPRRPDIVIHKPENFDEMKAIAQKLSEPFPHVRIDLYDIDGKLFLGEFTFYHSGGCGHIAPETESIRLGDLIDLSLIPNEYLC